MSRVIDLTDVAGCAREYLAQHERAEELRSQLRSQEEVEREATTDLQRALKDNYIVVDGVCFFGMKHSQASSGYQFWVKGAGQDADD